MFTEGEYDELYMYYNHFVSAISSEVTEKKLLPLTDIAPDMQQHASYEFEPSGEAILRSATSTICGKPNLWCSA